MVQYTYVDIERKEFMEFEKLISDRYSVRSFKNEHLPQTVIDKIIKAGHKAPTGCNYQPQRILVLNSDEAIAKLKNCTKCHFNAPIAALVCYNKEECWVRKYDGKNCGVCDASIVTTHMMLEAWELGIGSCWVGMFSDTAVSEALGLPENVQVTALLPMGYPAEGVEPLHLHYKHREIEEMVTIL